MLGKSLLYKLIVAPKYHCVPPNVWRSIPSGCQLGSQDLCCMCIEFTLCLFFSLFLWDKSWPSILCRDNAESFLWVSPESSCLQHSAILRSRVCLACYLESLTAPTFSSLNFSRIIVPEALSRLRVIPGTKHHWVIAVSSHSQQALAVSLALAALQGPWVCGGMVWPAEVADGEGAQWDSQDSAEEK